MNLWKMAGISMRKTHSSPWIRKKQHAGLDSHDIPLRIPMLAWHIFTYISSWWLKNPFEKHMSQNGVKIPNFRGENSKYLSWHHPDVEYKNQQKQGKIEPHTSTDKVVLIEFQFGAVLCGLNWWPLMTLRSRGIPKVKINTPIIHTPKLCGSWCTWSSFTP